MAGLLFAGETTPRVRGMAVRDGALTRGIEKQSDYCPAQASASPDTDTNGVRA